MKTIVTNLKTFEETVYIGITPRQAVVAAYAQYLKDFNTFNYSKYDFLVDEREHTVLCQGFMAYTEAGLKMKSARREKYLEKSN